jgi:hypothetical protein
VRAGVGELQPQPSGDKVRQRQDEYASHDRYTLSPVDTPKDKIGIAHTS